MDTDVDTPMVDTVGYVHRYAGDYRYMCDANPVLIPGRAPSTPDAASLHINNNR